MGKAKIKFWMAVFLRFFVISFVIVALVVSVAMIVAYDTAKLRKSSLADIVSSAVGIQRKIILNDIKSVASDINILASSLEIKKLLEDNSVSNRKGLADLFLSMSTSKKIYDQIRYIDISGQEIVRVNYASGNPYIVKESELQSKKHRYYFESSLNADKGKVYVSPLDLNIENKKIEMPIKPMIRFGVPVYNANDEKSGVIILNYLAEEIIKDIKFFAKSSIGNVSFYNSDGYAFISENSDDEWAFMFEGRKSRVLGSMQPHVWTNIKEKDRATLMHEGSLYSHEIVKFEDKYFYFGANNILANGWIILNRVPVDQYNKFVYEEFYHLRHHMGFFLVPLLIVAFLLSRSMIIKESTERDLKSTFEKVIMFQKELKDSNDQLRESNDQKNKFLGIAAHDLRNPIAVINAISSYIIDLKKDDVDKESFELIQDVYNTTKFMAELIDDILDVAKIGTGELHLKCEKSDYSVLLKKAVSFNRLIAEKKDIIINLQAPTVIPHFMFDSNRIEQVLNNLLSNAVKYSYPESEIVVSIKVEDKHIITKVQDNGQGIPEDELHLVFDTFVKTSVQATAGEKSTGLGLAIVKKIVEAHKGSVSVSSRVGQGSVFAFVLPLS